MSKRIAAHSFTSSAAKDYIRSQIDRNIIKSFKLHHFPEQNLSYLGLPGPELLDILSWREFLGYCTAVEKADVVDELELNALKNHLEHMVHVVCADIDELIQGENGHIKLHWPYQIINLDYYGGLINAKVNGTSRTSRRLETLKKLFERQLGAAFILFLTLNLRDDDRGELDELVMQQEEDLLGLDLEGVAECFDKHRELNHAGLLKIYVPILLDNIAKQHTLVFIPPILYQGTQQMIHFAVHCIPYTVLGAGRVSMTRERIDLINLPLFFLHNHSDLQKIDLGQILIKSN
jgi:hypothetical protein